MVIDLLRRFGKHRPDLEALSAHMDGRLAAREAVSVGAHLDACETCRAAADGLRSARDLLAAMPVVDHPRSFRVREADLFTHAPSPAPKSLMRFAPALSGVAAAVFVVVLSADILAGNSGARDASEPAARTGMTQADTGASQAIEAAPRINPPDTGTSVPVPGVLEGEAGTGTAGGQDFSEDDGSRDGDAAGGAGAGATPSLDAQAGAPEAAVPEAAVTPGAALDETALDEPSAGAGDDGGSASAGAGGENEAASPAPTPLAGEAAEQAAPGETPVVEAATAAAGVLAPDTAPVATNTPAEVFAFSGEDDAEDGNFSALRVVQIAAAAVALLAGAAFVAWRWRQRGELS